ncbi:MAG: hypothetical protein U1E23_14855 [Reyranellaceae bacterium]
MSEPQDLSPPPRAELLERAIAAWRRAGGDRVMAHLLVDCVFDAPPAPVPEDNR